MPRGCHRFLSPLAIAVGGWWCRWRWGFHRSFCLGLATKEITKKKCLVGSTWWVCDDVDQMLLLNWLGTAQPLGIEGRAGHHFK
jgi:hypothetical protein